MLLDSFMPSWDVADRHEVVVRATPDVAYAAARRVDFAAAPVARLLFALRGIGAPRKLRLEDATRWGFALLGEGPGHELVIGTVGRSWRIRQGRLTISAAMFRSHALPGTAKAAMALRVEPIDHRHSRVITETRVLCADEGSRRRFRRYWRSVRFGSALIRRAALARIKVDAERAGVPSPTRQ